jgi:RNA polymerase sigma factor (TIGR02999 family)
MIDDNLRQARNGSETGLTTAEILPTVYDQLRRLAARLIAREKPGQTLQPTALVHEAYMRLKGRASPSADDGASRWVSRQHFFLVAAETMRRVLIDGARRKQADKRGGNPDRFDLDLDQVAAPESAEGNLAFEDAIARLAQTDATAAELVRLYYFSGLTVTEAATKLSLSTRTAERLLAYARAWLVDELIL